MNIVVGKREGQSTAAPPLKRIPDIFMRVPYLLTVTLRKLGCSSVLGVAD